MTNPPNAPDHGCSCGRPDCQYDKAWGNPLRETQSAPDDKPNATEVDVLSVLTVAACSVASLANIRRDAGLNLAADIYEQESKEIDLARTAVAALLTREAALVAEVAGLREDIADRNRTIECKNIDIRERDSAINGWATTSREWTERAKKAESERDALAAEAERWKAGFISARAQLYIRDGMKVEQARIHAETDAQLAAIDAARAEAGHW